MRFTTCLDEAISEGKNLSNWMLSVDGYGLDFCRGTIRKTWVMMVQANAQGAVFSAGGVVKVRIKTIEKGPREPSSA